MKKEYDKLLGRNPELRKSILRKLASENDFVWVTELLNHLSSEGIPADYTRVTRDHLDILTQEQVLEGPKKYIKNNDAQFGYKLKNQIDVLKLLFYGVYGEVPLRLLKTEYYKNMIGEIIEFFDKELQKQNLGYLKDLDIKFLEIFLTYSVTCLHFILDSEKYSMKFKKYDNVLRIDNLHYLIEGYAAGLVSGFRVCDETLSNFNIEINTDIRDHIKINIDDIYLSAHHYFETQREKFMIIYLFEYFFTLDEMRFSSILSVPGDQILQLIRLRSEMLEKHQDDCKGTPIKNEILFDSVVRSEMLKKHQDDCKGTPIINEILFDSIGCKMPLFTSESLTDTQNSNNGPKPEV